MANPRTGSTPTTLQASDFPQNIAPHAKYKANFAGTGTPDAPYIGGWLVDGPVLSHDTEAHAWLKGQGFHHHGRRWQRIDGPVAPAQSAAEIQNAMAPASDSLEAIECGDHVEVLTNGQTHALLVVAVTSKRFTAMYMHGNVHGASVKFRKTDGRSIGTKVYHFARVAAREGGQA